MSVITTGYLALLWGALRVVLGSVLIEIPWPQESPQFSILQDSKIEDSNSPSELLQGCQPPLSLDLAGQYKRSSKYMVDEHSMDHVSLVFGSSKWYVLVFFYSE